MHDEPGVGVACLLELFGAQRDEVDADARAHVGAMLLLEIVMLLRAIVKGLSSG